MLFTPILEDSGKHQAGQPQVIQPQVVHCTPIETSGAMTSIWTLFCLQFSARRWCLCHTPAHASDALATHRLSDNVESMALPWHASNQRLACLRQCCQMWPYTAGMLVMSSCSCKVLRCRLYNLAEASLAALQVSCALFGSCGVGC